MEFPTLEKICEDLERAKKAHELLEKVWLEKGPYDLPVSDKLRYEIQDYFNFDDGE